MENYTNQLVGRIWTTKGRPCRFFAPTDDNAEAKMIIDSKQFNYSLKQNCLVIDGNTFEIIYFHISEDSKMILRDQTGKTFTFKELV